MSEEEKSVLIAEDEKSLLRVLGKKLQKHGFKTIEAGDGEQAIEMALEHKPDIILLDQLMPKFSGLAVLKRLRADEWGASVPVIIMTNVAEGTKTHMELSELADRYLTKANVSLDEIIDAVNLELQQPHEPHKPTAEPQVDSSDNENERNDEASNEEPAATEPDEQDVAKLTTVEPDSDPQTDDSQE